MPLIYGTFVKKIYCPYRAIIFAEQHQTSLSMTLFVFIQVQLLTSLLASFELIYAICYEQVIVYLAIRTIVIRMLSECGQAQLLRTPQRQPNKTFNWSASSFVTNNLPEKFIRNYGTHTDLAHNLWLQLIKSSS